MIAEVIENKVSIENLAQSCIEQGFPFAIYRLPAQDKQYLILSFDKSPYQKIIDFETCESAFVMAAFDIEKELPYVIKADLFLEINGGFCDITDKTLPFFIKNQGFKATKIIFNKTDDSEEKSNYILKVNSAIQQLKESNCNKVVLSRIKEIGHVESINYFEIFDDLCGLYPNAFVSTVFLPWKNQIWIGATPEILVSQDKEGIFKTVALAGTQPSKDALGNKISEKEALWSQKEIEEQAIVGRYIINSLKKIRVREFQEQGPKTINAGNLLHLCSSYLINTNEIDFSNFVSTMLSMLHPTPAVCGMPKPEALKIINQLEKHSREFYSGYLGPINIEGESYLFVNLRTIKIEKNTISAFAGGGLTNDSIPEKEWNETQLKLMTISMSFNQ